MIELINGINFHNFMLDGKPKSWFYKGKEEPVDKWIKRIAYQGSGGFFSESKWRLNNKYWLKDSIEISLSVLTFLRENNMEKETLEDLVGFELDLKGSYDWKLSDVKKLELILNKKLL